MTRNQRDHDIGRRYTLLLKVVDKLVDELQRLRAENRNLRAKTKYHSKRKRSTHHAP